MKKALLLMFILMTAFVAAAYSLTNLSLQGTAGSSVTGTVALSGDGANDPVSTLTSTNLVSGSNTISSNNIVITSIENNVGINTVDKLLAETFEDKWSVKVNIPANQPAGVYTGTLKSYISGSLVAQSTITVTVQSNVSSGTSITMSQVSLGSDDQAREETVTGNLAIANTGTTTVSLTLNSNVPAIYQLSLSQNTVTLASGQSVNIPVTVYVPDSQDSGTETIGTITATGSGLSQNANVVLETRSEIEITKVKVDVDGESETADDGDEVDANAGDDVTLTVTVRNNFDENIDIEDVEIEIESDSDLDWDDSDDLGDISDGDKEEMDFSFNIDSDIDEDEYDVEVRVTGEDENGATHEHTITFTVNIDKENHEITVQSVTLSPNRVSCDARTVTVRANLENTGSNDEDDVSIVVENSELGVYEYDTRLNLDEDDDVDKSFTFTVPKNARTGEYLIHVTGYYDNDRESDEEIVSLFVDPCSSSTNVTGTTGGTTGGNSGNNGGTTLQPIVYPSGTVGPSYGSTSFFNSPMYVVVLVVAVLIFLVLITLLLVKFVF